MRRRDFIVLGSAAAGWPLTATAQRMPLVGILSGTNRDERNVKAILTGLNEAGFDEGRSYKLEVSLAQGQFERLPALAAEMVRREVDVIVAIQSATAPRAAKAATATIPVVFSIGGDPVALGLVESLSRPGGNVTGATFLVNSLSGKRLEALRDLLPAATVMGLLVNPKNPAAPSETADVQAAARALGLQLIIRHASNEQDIDAAFAEFAAQRISAVTFAADAVFNARRAQIIALAARYALPTMYFYREFANAGGLITYGGYDTDAYRLAGVYAGRILKGEKPADLPVQQVTKVELVINIRTAKTLGIEVPLSLLGRADDMIE
jgi:putative ABC transport system substrate-binding protein